MPKASYILFACLVFLLSCKNQEASSKYIRFQGETMGTTYHITCDFDETGLLLLEEEVEGLLVEINNAVNHYLPNSLISQFNLSQSGKEFDLQSAGGRHFYNNIAASRRVVNATNNNFDPTVGPLVNYWGFGSTGKYNLTKIDSLKIDSLMATVSFNRILIKKESNNFIVEKSDPRVQLDFSAIAKGYAVDQVAELMSNKKIENFLVEIGGETKVAGLNPKGKKWTMAISEPRTDAALNEIYKIVAVTDKSMATSGNYRNNYEVQGRMLSHTINPLTGYPEQSNLLSATIFHDECMYADAYATACMVMGLEQSLRFVHTHPELSHLFIFTDENGQLAFDASENLDILQ